MAFESAASFRATSGSLSFDPRGSSPSNLVLPVTEIRSGGAPSEMARSASASSRIRKRSICRSGCRSSLKSAR